MTILEKKSIKKIESDIVKTAIKGNLVFLDP